MAWQYAAMVGINMYTAGLQAKEQIRAEGTQNALRAEQRRLETNRETEAALFNIQSTKQQELSDTMNIELAAARAEDEALIATAGSGLSGASIDDINAEIQVEVNKDKVKTQREASQRINEITSNLRYSNENRNIESSYARINTNARRVIQDAGLNSSASVANSYANRG